MTGGDLLSKVRLLIGETAQTRWTDPALFGFLNDAQRQIAYEIDFPEATYQIVTVANQREYQMLDVVKTLRVYMIAPGGVQQPLPLVDISTLEGTQLEIYDQSSANTQGQPVDTPQWLAQQPQAYPVQSPWVGQFPYPTSLPWQSSQSGLRRPVSYMRGGFLGIVPPPAAVYTIQVDCISSPPNLNSNADDCIFPDGFKDALCYKTAEYVFVSDRSSQAENMRQRFEAELPKLRSFLINVKGTMPKRMTPITKRTFFRGRCY